MKKSNHITINLNDNEYSLIKKLAALERRSISELCYLILIDNANLLFLDKQSKPEFKPAVFIPLNKEFN